MNFDYADDGSPGEARPVAARHRLTLPLSLLLVGFSYILFVSGPLLAQRLSPMLSGGATGSLPTPIALGIALVGAALMVFVLARLVRDVDSHPYVSVAPVLAVFLGLVLSSAKAGLPLAGVTGEHLGLFALALPLLGGALIGRAEPSVRILGWALSIMPVVGVAVVLTSAGGYSNPLTMWSATNSSVRTYLTLLAASSGALSLLGTVARRMSARKESAGLDRSGEHAPMMLMPRPEALPSYPPPPARPGTMPPAMQGRHSMQATMPPRPLQRPSTVPPMAGRRSSIPPQMQAQGGHTAPRRLSVPPQHRSTLLGHVPSMPAGAQPLSAAQHAAPQSRAGHPFHGRFESAAPVPPSFRQAAPVAPLFPSLEDDDDELLVIAARKKARGLKIAASASVAAVVLLGVYVFVLQPAREQAVVAAAPPAAAGGSPSATPEQQAKDAAEVRAAEERLREVLTPSTSAVGSAAPMAAAEPSSAGQPVVTALAGQAPVRGVPTTSALPAAARAEPAPARGEKIASHRSHRSSRSHHSAKAEPKLEATKAPAAAAKAKAPVERESTRERAASSRSAATSKPAATSSEDLDLDQLVEKAMRSGSKGGSVKAADDPLLGL